MFTNYFPNSYNCGGFGAPFSGGSSYGCCSPSQMGNWNGFGGFNSYGNSFPQNSFGWNTPAWNNSQSCFSGYCSPMSSVGSPWNSGFQPMHNWNMSSGGMFGGCDWNSYAPQNSFGLNNAWNGFGGQHAGFGSIPSSFGWQQPYFGGFDYNQAYSGQQFPHFGGFPSYMGEFCGSTGFGGTPFGYQGAWNFPYGGYGMTQYPGYTPAQHSTAGINGQGTPGGFNPSVVRDAA